MRAAHSGTTGVPGQTVDPRLECVGRDEGTARNEAVFPVVALAPIDGRVDARARAGGPELDGEFFDPGVLNRVSRVEPHGHGSDVNVESLEHGSEAVVPPRTLGRGLVAAGKSELLFERGQDAVVAAHRDCGGELGTLGENLHFEPRRPWRFAAPPFPARSEIEIPGCEGREVVLRRRRLADASVAVRLARRVLDHRVHDVIRQGDLALDGRVQSFSHGRSLLPREVVL